MSFPGAASTQTDYAELHLRFNRIRGQGHRPHQDLLGPGNIAQPQTGAAQEEHCAIRVWVRLHGFFQQARGFGWTASFNPLIAQINPCFLSRFKLLNLGEEGVGPRLVVGQFG